MRRNPIECLRQERELTGINQCVSIRANLTAGMYPIRYVYVEGTSGNERWRIWQLLSLSGVISMVI